MTTTDPSPTPHDPNQPSLFDTLRNDPTDHVAAERRKRKGMSDSEAAAGTLFRAMALDLVEEWLRTHPDLHGPDFTAWASPQLPSFKDARSLGGTFTRARNLGWMSLSNERRRSPSSNNSLTNVWRSLLFEGDRQLVDA